MKMTLISRDELVDQARKLTGTREAGALVQQGLEALIEKKSRERLAALGGSDPRAGRRRRG